MIVDFMIIGAMKSGTTTLAKILENHPQVSFSKIKEPDFFSKSVNWKESLSEYEALFEQSEGKVYGEGSTSYTKYPDLKLNIWEDIYEYNPKMKFIYLVRNPIQRAISHYMHIYERGYIDHTLEEAIITVPELINYSRYSTQINPFIKQFGKEKVLVIDFDDLNNKRDEVLRRVANFIGVEFKGFKNFENTHSNTSLGGTNKINHKFDFLNTNPFFLNLRSDFRKFIPDNIRKKAWKILTNKKSRVFMEKPQLSSIFQQVIHNLLEIEIKELEKIIEKDLSHWLKIKDCDHMIER